jgi:6-phosphofructokinase 1
VNKGKVAVLTSGGDSPGMNAAIRSIVRVSISNGLGIYGVQRGYKGLYEGDFKELSTRDVSDTIKLGGTILETSRFPELKKEKIQKELAERIKKYGFETIFIIGGNGSLKGAYALSKYGTSSIVLPGSIDNDIPGTEISIGVDTALNTILFAVDRIKDTATSHERAFLIEVMGRNSGYLALEGAIATGAELAIIPECSVDIDKIIEQIKKRKKDGKKNCIILLAEGAIRAVDLEKKLEGKIPYDVRITILGHIQRGGSPTAYDRILATRLGRMAVEQHLIGNKNILIGFSGITYSVLPLERVVNMVKPVPMEDLKTLKYLSI